MSGTTPGSLLTRPEQHLYGRLVRAFPGHVILAHVAVSQVLAAGGATGQNGRPRPGTIDFLVCRPDFTALAAIDIDVADVVRDPRHDRSRRRDELLRGVGIKVLRVRAADLPGEAALKALVAALPLRVPAPQLMRRAS